VHYPQLLVAGRRAFMILAKRHWPS
jgi:hypothetical protein